MYLVTYNFFHCFALSTILLLLLLDVFHGFTAWGGGAYNELADWRSWDAMLSVFDMILMEESSSSTMDTPAVVVELEEEPAMPAADGDSMAVANMTQPEGGDMDMDMEGEEDEEDTTPEGPGLDTLVSSAGRMSMTAGVLALAVVALV